MSNENRKRKSMSDWLDDDQHEPPINQSFADVAHHDADALVVHGLLQDLAKHDDSVDERRMLRLLTQIEQKEELTQHAEAESSLQTIVYSERKSDSARISTLRIAIAVLAACLLIAVGFTLWQESNDDQFANSNSESAPVVATLVQEADAQWVGEQLRAGDSLTSQVLSIKSGMVRLQFVDRVEVTLEGPAEYEILGVGHSRLYSGLLAANVPPGAEGFRVETPAADIVDLGTSFGVHINNDGKSNVAVFEGEVEVTAKGLKSTRLLREGESVDISIPTENTAPSISPVKIETAPFERVWPVVSGIAGSTENFRVAPPWPRAMRFIQSDEMVSVVTEGHPVELESEVRLNISQPGEYRKIEQLTPVDVSKGARVRSYFLQFKPESRSGRPIVRRFEGTITFESPIFGVIGLAEEMSASDEVFAKRISGRPPLSRSLELSDRVNGDVISLSDDRLSLTLSLSVPSNRSDCVRVIVDAEIPGAINE